MATIDNSIYNALSAPRKSAFDYADEFQQRGQAKQMNALQLQSAQMQAQQVQQAMADDAAVRNEFANGLDVSTPEGQARLYKAAPTKAGGILKDRLGMAKDQASIAKDTAETQAKQYDLTRKKFEHGIMSVVNGPTPEAIKQSVSDGVRQGVYSMQEAQQILSDLPTDPAQLQAWKLQQLQHLLPAKDALDQHWKAMKFNLEQNNELIGLDGKPNMPLIDTKKQISAAGKPSVSVNVPINTEKTYAGNVAEGLAKNDIALIEAARTAPDRVRSSQEVKRILDTEKPITGSAADVRLGLNKALSTAGLIDGTNVKSTEDLVALLNSQTLDAIKTSGLGSGQGFTDKDRQFLQDAKSGRIEINKDTLRRMADLNERAARASIEAGNKVARRLKSNQTMGSVGQDLEVTAPDEYKALSIPPDAIRAEAERRAKLRNGGK